MRFLAALCVLLAGLAHADPQPMNGLLVWIPQSDEQAASWVRFMDQHPTVRLVLAISPRFTHILKEATLKTRLTELQTQGRLVLALQIPNAPHLPLLENSGTATPYRYPDDVIQHLAQARGSFVKNWGVSPTGVVLPYGAISPAVLKILGRSGFFWTIGAAGLPAASGSWRQQTLFSRGAITLWDASPSSTEASAGLQLRVWDDREMKSMGKAVETLDRWMKEWDKSAVRYILPDDAGLSEPQSLEEGWLQRRTWTRTDWDGWVGAPEKNAMWNQLRRTREAVEAYQNSGEAQMTRLDAALAELFTAQNSNYFLSAGNPQQSDAEREDRQQEFQATLSNVFRFIGKTPPEDLFKPLDRSELSTTQSSMTVVMFDHPAEGVDRMQFTREDIALRRLDVTASTDTVTWSLTLGTTAVQSVELYIDINGLSGVGTSIPLPRRALRIHPDDAWEYALRVQKDLATLYRTQSGGTFAVTGTFPVTVAGDQWSGVLPRTILRGSIRRWGYQAILIAPDETIAAQLSQPRFARGRGSR